MKLDLALDEQDDTQDLINRRVYHAKGIDKTYQRVALNRAETLALLKYQTTFANRDVLDVGVGAGRTTIYLAPLARRYEAIDYSPVMVDAMRRSWPAVSTSLADMRDLSAFAARSFDFVMASNNVLDAVSHPDRLRSLAEISRVLKPGGTLMFSAHNREFDERLRKPHLNWSRNPVNLSRHALTWARQHFNHSTLQKLHAEHGDYALYSDEGHDFACLHYYIDQRAQRRQLQHAGFTLLEVMDDQGKTLSGAEPASESGWLMYIAKAGELA
jgi:SAM-dependent methyltransferase